MRAPDPSSTRRRRRGALIALAMTVASVVGFSTGALAAPTAHGAVTAKAASSSSVSEYRLGALYFAGKGSAKTSTVGNGGSLVLSGAWRVRWWGSQVPPRLTLQRKIGSAAWRTTSAKVTLGANGITARTPKYSTAAAKRTVAYRFVSSPYSGSKGAVRGTSRSHAVRISYENQRRYTGLAAAVYGYAKAYCPNTAVHVASLGSDHAGDYETGTLLIRAIPSVAGYSATNLRALSLHECSHQRQWLNYGGTSAGHTRMKAAAARIFSTWTLPAGTDPGSLGYPYTAPDPSIVPIEHAADCGAQALNPGGYLGYGGYCTAAELAAGARLLQGGKY